MAFLVYSLPSKQVVFAGDTKPVWVDDSVELDGEIIPTYKVFEQDYDSSEVAITSLKLSEDGNSLVNAYPGKTLAEQRAAFDAEGRTRKLKELREVTRGKIKSMCRDLLNTPTFKWKIKKAKETDAFNGNNNAVTAVYNERKAIRDKNNELEAKLDNTPDSELENFDYEGYGSDITGSIPPA
tara:strand:- start:138 stop:683 length:546 start_codon:yes stop_codon:yes gene_type:complete